MNRYYNISKDIALLRRSGRAQAKPDKCQKAHLALIWTSRIR